MTNVISDCLFWRSTSASPPRPLSNDDEECSTAFQSGDDAQTAEKLCMLKPLDLTTALRPSLKSDETLLFVQDGVGLYGGKAKLADYQNGHIYLTSHRVCYVDNEHPRERAVAVELKDVERCEVFGRFLKSSPKLTLIPKAAKFGPAGLKTSADPPVPTSPGLPGSRYSNSGESARPSLKDATWVCPICSFSNPVPSNFDPSVANANTPIPPCLACGIKPPLAHVTKAVINNLGSQQRAAQSDRQFHGTPSPQASTADLTEEGVRCPRCTFQNHSSLTACEMCGTSLVIATKRVPNRMSFPSSPTRSSTPSIAQGSGVPILEPSEDIKLSFRAGGEKVCHERLKGALTQRKWLINSAPPVPKGEGASAESNDQQQQQRRGIGIAGLERRGAELRKNNEVVIGNAFEDLAALMASAKEIIALAESLSSQSQSSADKDDTGSNTYRAAADADMLLSQLNLTTTKDMLSSSKKSANNLYLNELCRSIAEFITDDRRSILKNAGGVMSLVDLWAVFNRSRGGVELVSPNDFTAAAELFDKLSLPVRLRRFRSGLLVVQERNRTDEKTIAALLEWLQMFKEIPPDVELTWEWREWGRGVTAQETAERFSWSIGIASEELEMAEEHGVLCRESGIEGVKFWENCLGQAEIVDFDALREEENQKIIQGNLREIGLF